MMGEQTSAGSAAADSPTEPSVPRRPRWLIGTVFALATIIGLFAVLAVWTNRQVLNTDNWTNTSSRLLEDKTIQTAVAAYAVNQLFSSGVPQAQIKAVLPARLQGAAGPVSAGLEQLAGQIAPRVLASQQVQTAWRAANHAAHATLLKIINGGNSLRQDSMAEWWRWISTESSMHWRVHLGVQSQVAAARSALQSNAGTVQGAANKAGITLPPSTGQLVILRSNQLKTLQNIAKAIKGLALLLPLLAFALFALAVWLSRGHRRKALRLTGWCFVGIGILVLIVQALRR